MKFELYINAPKDLSRFYRAACAGRKHLAALVDLPAHFFPGLQFSHLEETQLQVYGRLRIHRLHELGETEGTARRGVEQVPGHDS